MFNKKLQALVIFFLFLCLAYFLSLVFSGGIILSQAFSLGPITFRYYGLFMALAVASGFYLAIKRSSKYNLTTKQSEDILFYTIIGGFIGARLYHVLSSWQFYLNNPADIFKVWNGGLSIYGVVFGGIISLWIYCRLPTTNYQLPTLLNWLTPSLIAGQIIGRFGNMFNYELYGYPSNLPWKMFVPVEFRESDFIGSNFFHPLFLYEQLGLLIILLIISRLENKKSDRPVVVPDPGSNASRLSGTSLFFWYVLLYNILRIPLEFMRIESVFIGGVRQNALVSFLLILIVIVLLVKYARRKERVFS